MKAASLLAAGLLAIAGNNPADPDLTATRPRLDSLAGRWKVVHSQQYYGKQLHGDQFKGYRFTIESNRLRVANADYPYHLDADHEPRRIDIMVEGSKVEGIYRFDGSQLTLCYPMGGHDRRPTRFAALPDSKVVLLVLEKE